MSWFHACTIDANARNHSTAAEIVACFRDKQTLLIKLALLITGDHTTAEQAVANACEITIQGNSPFRDWLFEWAKAVTMTCAITSQGNAIRAYEVLYKDRRCPHIEHLCQLSDERRTAGLQLIFQMDEQKVVAELDPLCRAILVLRTAIRSSIQDCSLRLNVSRSAAAAANCLAMTWLDYRHMKPLEDDNVQADIGSRQSGRAPSS